MSRPRWSGPCVICGGGSLLEDFDLADNTADGVIDLANIGLVAPQDATLVG